MIWLKMLAIRLQTMLAIRLQDHFLPHSILVINDPVNIYLFKAVIETLEKGVKYVHG